MPFTYDDDLLREGILRFKCKEYAIAQRYLERALSVADDHETRLQASFYLSQIVTDPHGKRRLLEDVLAIDPLHPEARRALAILDGKLKPEEIINPDRLPVQPDGIELAAADRFTCPTCGGRMTFAPDGQSLTCDFCNGRQQVSTELAEEQDFLLTMATVKGHLHSESMHTFHCKGCGADFVLAPDVLSATCAYCGSVHVINVNECRELIPPQAILPFLFDRRQAELILLDWLRQKPLRPERKPDPPRGLYVPIWTFDLVSQIPWSYETEVNEGFYGRKQIVKGQAALSFDDVPVIASRRQPRGFSDVLAGYSLHVMVAYDPRYLADWPAQAYDASMSDASLDARAWAARQGREQARLLSNAGPVRVTNFQTGVPRISIASYKLALVSVWMAAYVVDGRSYDALLDSQTGQVYAESPQVGGLMGWIGKALGA